MEVNSDITKIITVFVSSHVQMSIIYILNSTSENVGP